MSKGCPACGARVDKRDAVCRSCFTPLGAPATNGSAATNGTAGAPPADTRRSPAGGLHTYPEPYPAWGRARGPTIAGGEVIQVTAVRGAWAEAAVDGQVVGWVEGHALVPPIEEPVKPLLGPSVALAPDKSRAEGLPFGMQVLTVDAVVAALAALSIVIGALIDWTDGVIGVNSFKIPAEFLFDPKTTSRSPKIGYFLLVIGLVALVAALFTRALRSRVVLGLLAVTIAVLFCAQVGAALPDNQTSFTDVVGAGPWITGFAGMVLVLSPLLKPRL